MKHCSVIILILLTFQLVSPVSAAGAGLSYDGISGSCVFRPDSTDNPTQLFRGFSQLPPGDLLTDRIVLCGSDSMQEINAYLRLDMPALEGAMPYLSQFYLEIRDLQGHRVFSGTLEKALQWIYLGTCAPEEYLVLDLTLSSSLQTARMHDDFSWRFLASEIVTDPGNCTGTDFPPPTGDRSPLLPGIILLVISLSALVFLPRKHPK